MKRNKTSSNKPTRKLLFSCIVTGLLLVLLCTVLARDNWRHKQVSEAMDITRTSLSSGGFTDMDISSGCGRTQPKYGDGAKVCTVSLHGSRDYANRSANLSQQQLLDIMNKDTEAFYQSIEKTGLYRREGNIPSLHLPGKGFSFGSRYHEHISSGSSCSALVDINWEKELLELDFYCRDTSWLDRTFNNGRFSP